MRRIDWIAFAILLAGCLPSGPPPETEDERALSQSQELRGPITDQTIDESAICTYHYKRHTPEEIYWSSNCGGTLEDHETPWAVPSTTKSNSECIGACGAGCPTHPNPDALFNHASCEEKTAVGPEYLVAGLICKDKQTWMHCYSTECCYYHDLCDRSGFSIMGPICTEFAFRNGCAPCYGLGYRNCASDTAHYMDFPQSTKIDSCRSCSHNCPPQGGFNECGETCLPSSSSCGDTICTFAESWGGDCCEDCGCPVGASCKSHVCEQADVGTEFCGDGKCGTAEELVGNCCNDCGCASGRCNHSTRQCEPWGGSGGSPCSCDPDHDGKVTVNECTECCGGRLEDGEEGLICELNPLESNSYRVVTYEVCGDQLC